MIVDNYNKQDKKMQKQMEKNFEIHNSEIVQLNRSVDEINFN